MTTILVRNYSTNLYEFRQPRSNSKDAKIAQHHICPLATPPWHTCPAEMSSWRLGFQNAMATILVLKAQQLAWPQRLEENHLLVTCWIMTSRNVPSSGESLLWQNKPSKWHSNSTQLEWWSFLALYCSCASGFATTSLALSPFAAIHRLATKKVIPFNSICKMGTVSWPSVQLKKFRPSQKCPACTTGCFKLSAPW